ncbi:MAG: hypothetical protein LBH69_00455 [Methanomassiliicoccaceae archaeon]|jgi:hypothetical protein|nr:hypothetical protein [Methanomassiliicoccaceae archaeon]
MMEFTLARVCLSVCGLMLLAAVLVPVTGMYESHTSSMESDVSGNVAKLIDGFYCSEMDEMTVSMTDILPGGASYLEFSGTVVTMTTDRGVYMSGTNVPVLSEYAFGRGDIIKLSKGDGFVTAERLI